MRPHRSVSDEEAHQPPEESEACTEINSGVTSVSASYIQFVRFQIGLM
ncbi:hypothetical protein H7U05_17105 [Priestia megaterium]|nr:hypothetical protein [Priestia megaterium]MBY0199013.1 hypothetical protein [Priestia megaterium]